ncbi:MAG TPA: hypothetical protein DD738_00885, partial [Ruminiclostridium sp.]|nr:hypothetical protein [Ruminiclostridium sp.]
MISMPPCFCGSGKEEKYCHPDVHPLSTVGRMLVFYRDLDISIGNLGNVCIQSCCDCCYDYFYISLKEFFAILHFIRSQRGEWYLKKKILMAKDNLEALKRQSPEEYQRLNSTFDKIPLDISMVRKLFNDTQYVKKLNRPCIFLQHGQCEIYQVRPYICRLYGSAI